MNEQVLKVFKPEAKEYIQKLNENLLALEKNPADEAAVDELLRAGHALKGSSAMVGFTDIAKIAHEAESAVNEIKESNIEDISSVSSALFECFDTVELILSGESVDVNEVISGLKKAVREMSNGEVPKEENEKNNSAAEVKDKNSSSKVKTPSLDTDDTVRVSVDKVNELMNLVGVMLLNWQKLQNYSLNLRREIESLASFDSPEIAEAKKKLLKMAKSYKENVKVLDSTVNMLQDVVMGIRMLPVSTVFSLLPRVIHDIANEYNKKVDVEINGENTELDKRMIENLKDPLIHIIRNAIYHGIESPEQRREKGKKECGKIILSAYQQGDRVCVEVSDDGKGIDGELIKQAAVRKGFLKEEDAEKLGAGDALQLIFDPGFSSRDEADDISGRGVGLDLVKKNIEENLAGQVLVKTSVDGGTSFTLILPLTLLINSGLLVETGGQTFVFLVNAVETVAYIKSEQIRSVEGEPAIKIRGYTVPLLALDEVLKMERKGGSTFEQPELPVIVINHAGRKLAFAVNHLIGQRDVVIKTLKKPIGKMKNIAGVTILENGAPAVILHIPDLIEEAKTKTSFFAGTAPEEKSAERKSKMKKIIIAEDSATTRNLEKSILESSGFEVEAAVDGMQAYKKIKDKDGKYDLLITDINMPNLDGLDLCRKIKNDEKLKALPVIIVSSLGEEEDKKRGLEVKADAYIVKSEFRQRKLIETIERLIG
ncbi:MAG: hybrid sensor histidine kinase/response regulator [Elusimicrobiota bacterium]